MRTVLITGATGGIGSALANVYADANTRLILTGRDAKSMATVTQACKAKGAEVITKLTDVRSEEYLAWCHTIAQTQLPDIVIANAGFSSTTGAHREGETLTQIEQVLDINVRGTLRLITPMIEAMRQAKKGQVAIVSSVAGMRALPQSPTYSASKAALTIYGDSLRIFLKPEGVSVSLICPGFVKTKMSSRLSTPKPFLLSAEQAAKCIQKGLAKRKPYIIFPKRLYYLIVLSKLLPRFMIEYALNKFAV